MEAMQPTSQWTPSYFEENAERCSHLLQDQDILEQIPSLNTAVQITAHDKKLVRFRGMIQDILTPVYYIEKFQVRDSSNDTISHRSGKYCDVHLKENEEVVDSPSVAAKGTIYREKQMMHCVSVPAINSWTKQFKYVDDQLSKSRREGKRKLEVTGNCMDVDESFDTETLADRSNKKLLTEEKVMERVESSSLSPLCEQVEQNESEGVKGVLLLVYDCDSIKMQVNIIFEAVGFLSLMTDEDRMDDEKSYYDTLPRIHVIAMTPISSVFDHVLSIQKDQIFTNALTLREELWLILTDLLLGDTLAADYVLCHLISSVYLRKNDLVLGAFTLNISNVPTKIEDFEYVRSLYTFLAYLLEKSIYLPFTISSLNSTVMIPKQNTDENRLITGLLQVPSRTHIVIDETQMEPGQLHDRGVRNMRALSDIISTQRMEYDFEFYKLPYNTDIPILTLSNGNSLLPCDAHLVLEPDQSCVQNVRAAFSRTWQKMVDPLLSKLRVYLHTISSVEYNITTDMTQTIESDFVKMRRNDSRTTVGDLHKLMVLSRLTAVSKGYNTLPKDVWEYACQMEVRRKERL